MTASKKQPKRRRQRHRSNSRREKDSNTGTGDNNNLDGAKDENPLQPDLKREDEQASPPEQAADGESEDDNYMPLSDDEVSLGDEDSIVPEEPLEQEHFKCRLIATARSLKKKQQQLQAEQDLLADRWTEVLAAEEYELERPIKSFPKCRLLPQLEEEALKPALPAYDAADWPPRGHDKAAYQPEVQTAPCRQSNGNTKARGYTYDLRKDLENRAG